MLSTAHSALSLPPRRLSEGQVEFAQEEIGLISPCGPSEREVFRPASTTKTFADLKDPRMDYERTLGAPAFAVVGGIRNMSSEDTRVAEDTNGAAMGGACRRSGSTSLEDANTGKSMSNRVRNFSVNTRTAEGMYLLSKIWHFQESDLEYLEPQPIPQDDSAIGIDGFYSLRVKKNHTTLSQDDRAPWVVGNMSIVAANCCRRKQHLLKPSGFNRLVWDVFSLLFICYDTVSIPFSLAFDPPEEDHTHIISWVVLSFWTLDIIMSFNTGYYRNGEEELRRWPVAINYMKTWFMLDAGIVSIDWVTMIINADREQGVAVARFGKTLRTLRVVRSLRLLRVMKLRRLIEMVQDHIASDLVSIFVTMLKLIMLVLLVNHAVACIWYWLGSGQLSTTGWALSEEIQSRDLSYRYFTSLHWSLCQFTTGSMEINPATELERVFNVITLVFALLIFSSFLSSITAAMTQLRKLANKDDHDLTILRRFLKFRGVKANLSIRIMHYVEHQINARAKEIQERDVNLLKIISKPLEKELKQDLTQPKLASHPFFRLYALADDHAMQQVCYNAVKTLPLSYGDLVFTPRSSDGQMFFVSRGTLTYNSKKRQAGKFTSRPSESYGSADLVSPTPSGATGRYTDGNVGNAILEVDDHCCEGAIWTHWVHVGSLRAYENAEVLAVKADDFAVATLSHHQVRANACAYGRFYVLRLNEITMNGSPATSTVINDLANPTLMDTKRMAHEAFGINDSSFAESGLPALFSIGKTLSQANDTFFARRSQMQVPKQTSEERSEELASSGNGRNESDPPKIPSMKSRSNRSNKSRPSELGNGVAEGALQSAADRSPLANEPVESPFGHFIVVDSSSSLQGDMTSPGNGRREEDGWISSDKHVMVDQNTGQRTTRMEFTL